MAELCLFCNGLEPSYTPTTDYICPSCVMLLARADQADLKKAHAKAAGKGYTDKALALESFIIPEVKDGKRPKHKSVRRRIERRINRKGITRPVRS